MKLSQLRFVRAVAETRSFSKAAQMCNVTQPTLSAGVSQLERELGAALFERTTRHVALTEFGEATIPSISNIINEVSELEKVAAAYLDPSVKLIRIGLSPIVDMARVLKLSEAFRRNHPEVEFHFKECFLEDLDARLLGGQLDAAVWPDLPEHQDAYASFVLYRDPWLYLPSTHTSPPPGMSELADISDQMFVLTDGQCGLAQVTRRLFDQSRCELKEYPGRAVTYKAIEEWADLGIGAALLPASRTTADQVRRYVPLLAADGQPAKLDICISWRPSAAPVSHIRKFREFAARLLPL